MTDFDHILSVFAESPQLQKERKAPGAFVSIGALSFHFDDQLRLTRVMGKDSVLFTKPPEQAAHIL